MTWVVDEARRWIGTPFAHQGRLRGVGCDCLGLVLGVLGDYGPSNPQTYSQDWSNLNPDLFFNALKSHLNVSSGLEAGCLIGFSLRRNGPLQHVGILSQIGERPKFIHSYSGYGVVESALTEAWQRRIVARFDLPKGDDIWRR